MTGLPAAWHFMDEGLSGASALLLPGLRRRVTAGDHDAVAHLDDVVDIVDPQLTFDFGDDLHMAVVFFQNLADRRDVCTG